MEKDASHGTSWADQWDYRQDNTVAVRGSGEKIGKKSVALEKTKAVASVTLDKAKRGASVGLEWIKHKYHDHKARRNQKQ